MFGSEENEVISLVLPYYCSNSNNSSRAPLKIYICHMQIGVHVLVGAMKCVGSDVELTRAAPLGTETAPTVRTDRLTAFLIILNGMYER